MLGKNRTRSRRSLAKAALVWAAASTALFAKEESKGPETAVPSDDNFHVVSESAGNFLAQLHESVVPKNVLSGSLKVYALVPPDLSFQKLTETHLAVDTRAQAGPPGEAARRADDGRFFEQSIILDSLSNETPVSAEASFKGELIKTRIVEGPPAEAIAPLGQEEEDRYLASTPIMDHEAPAFRAWLKQEGLTRRNGEGVLQFGHRVHNFIQDNYTHEPNAPQAPSRKPSDTMKVRKSDCGGFGLLFVGIMRANGVPARTLWGRWAETQTDPEYGCWHVIPEFHVAGAGWIRALDKSFGQHGGNFVAFHIDTELELEEGVERDWAQSLIWDWKGSGDAPSAPNSGQWTVKRSTGNTDGMKGS